MMMLYGCEAWAITKVLNIISLQPPFLRTIARVTARLPHVYLLQTDYCETAVDMRMPRSVPSKRRVGRRSNTPSTAFKASGVCSHCFSTRNLHQSDGTAHSHGSRIKPCVGSHQPPLTSAQARAQSVAVDEASAPGNGGGEPVTMTQPEPHSRSHIDFQSGDEEVSRHPRQIGGRVMKHVPKGARFACARSLTDILQSIKSIPSGAEQWRQLLWFASNILTQPERAGRRRNLVNLVKRRIENHEMLRTKDEW